MKDPVNNSGQTTFGREKLRARRGKDESIAWRTRILTRSRSSNPRRHLLRRTPQLDIFFTAIFTVELSVNLFSHWLVPFISNGWSATPLSMKGRRITCNRPIKKCDWDGAHML